MKRVLIGICPFALILGLAFTARAVDGGIGGTIANPANASSYGNVLTRDYFSAMAYNHIAGTGGTEGASLELRHGHGNLTRRTGMSAAIVAAIVADAGGEIADAINGHTAALTAGNAVNATSTLQSIAAEAARIAVYTMETRNGHAGHAVAMSLMVEANVRAGTALAAADFRADLEACNNHIGASALEVYREAASIAMANMELRHGHSAHADPLITAIRAFADARTDIVAHYGSMASAYLCAGD